MVHCEHSRCQLRSPRLFQTSFTRLWRVHCQAGIPMGSLHHTPAPGSVNYRRFIRDRCGPPHLRALVVRCAKTHKSM